MELRELIFRLAGISAICLAALLAPVTVVERVTMLTAFSFGVGFASVLPGYDRAVARIVGPAVLLLAIGPATQTWVIVDLLALAIVGFASFDHGGMSRSVPALGLPIITLAFRTGEPVSGVLLAIWVAVVVVTLMLGNRVTALASADWLGLDDQPDSDLDDAVGGRSAGRAKLDRHLVRRSAQTIAAAALVVPIALLAAALTEHRFPDLGPARPRTGSPDGGSLTAHPGLLGGLDTGEPVALSDEEVLRVRADRPLYWRGLAYDQWDGRRWSRPDDADAIRWLDDGVSLPIPDDEIGDRSSDPSLTGAAASSPELPEPVVVRQEFRIQRAGLDVVLGGWRPVALWSTARAGRLGSDGSIAVDEPFLAGASWTVDSTVVPASADDLRRADPVVVAPTSAQVARFGNEDAVSQEVTALARSITEHAPTTYDKVKALEQWMDDNIHYTRDLDRLPEGMDAVDHLLLRTRRGYCEQIGSALVVMLRSLGIPARLVVGYVPGSYDAATGEWVSLGTDAHAWAEVWFPGIGWRGFDPTAGVALAADPAGTGLSIPLAPMAVSAIVGVAALGGLTLIRRGRRWVRPTVGDRVRQRRAAEELRAELERCGPILSLRWSSASTMRERGASLAAAGVDPDVVDHAVEQLEQLWYAQADEAAMPDPATSQQVSDLERAREAMSELVVATRRVANSDPVLGPAALSAAGPAAPSSSG